VDKLNPITEPSEPRPSEIECLGIAVDAKQPHVRVRLEQRLGVATQSDGAIDERAAVCVNAARGGEEAHDVVAQHRHMPRPPA